MRVGIGIEMLNLSLKAFGHDGVFNPTLIWDENSAILVDTGLPGQIDVIKAEMARAGVPLKHLKAVILTHQDIDHIGNIEALVNELEVEVYAHALDQPFIEGTRPLMKTDPSQMPAEEWEALPEPMKQIYANPPKVSVTKVLKDGEELPVFGGLQVIHTPGHTPGHISLYHKNSKTLIAADSMFCMNGQLKGPIAHVTPDIELAVKSLRKYLDYEVENVICYHGGLATEKTNEQLTKLVNAGMEAVISMAN